MNGNNVICEAQSSLRVGIPSTVKLHVQSEQLAVGHKLPIYPLFPEVMVKIINKREKFPFIYLFHILILTAFWYCQGNLFSFYELCKNYQWTIEDEKVWFYIQIYLFFSIQGFFSFLYS